MIRRLGLFRLPSRCSAAALQTRWAGTTTPPSTKGTRAGTRLFRAVASSDVQAARVLLDKGAATNVKDSGGNPPLHHAVERGSVEMARLLLSRDHCDVEATNEDSARPLMLAVRHGSIEMVKLLLEKGADVNVRDGFVGDVPLHEAIVLLNFNMVALLLEKGADVMTKDKMKRSLAIAVERRSAEIVSLLLDKMKLGDHEKDEMKRDHEAIINDALHTAVEQDSVDIARILIDNGAALDTKNGNHFTPLRKAIWRRNFNMVKLLLEKGADVNAKNWCGETPFHKAVGEGSIELVQLLIEGGADVKAKDSTGQTALHKAVDCGDAKVAMAKLLIEKGADVNAEDKYDGTPLHKAVGKESIELVRLLIKYGANMESKNHKGQTPLLQAVECGNVKLAKLLIEKGADVNAVGASNVTPLHRAVEYRRLEMAKLLIEKGAKVNTVKEPTALQKAVSNKDYDMIRLLVVNGADVNIKVERFNTTIGNIGGNLLHLVVRWPDCVEWAALFIEHGVDVNAVDRRGETPLERAVWYGSLEMVQLLVAKGATFDADVDKYVSGNGVYLTNAEISAIKKVLLAAARK